MVSMRFSGAPDCLDAPVPLGQPPYHPASAHCLHRAVLADRASAARAARAALVSGAPVDAPNTLYQSPLFVAAVYARCACVRLLLEFGAAANLRCGEQGCTPVHAACFGGSGRVLRLLLDAGGDLRLCDLSGRLPADWARLQREPTRRLKILRLVEGARLTGVLGTRDRLFTSSSGASGTSGSLGRNSGLRGLLRAMLHGESPSGSSGRALALSAAPASDPPWTGDCCESALQSDEGVHYTLGAFTEMCPHLYLHTPASLRRLIPRGVSVQECDSDSDTPATLPPSDLLIDECSALRRLRHPSLLLLMAVVPTAHGSSVALLFERVILGSLYTCLHRDGVVFTAKHMAQIGLQVCGALQFIHASGWLHCAVTSHAVQLMSRGRAKLACLEYAVDTTVGNSGVGVRHWRLLACRRANAVYGWMAAELMRTGVPTPACDVYSLCAVLWEMVHVQVPFADLSARAIQRLVLDQNRQLEVSSSLCPPFIAELLAVGLRHCVSDRDLQLSEVQFMLTALIHSRHSAWKLGSDWQHCNLSDASFSSSCSDILQQQQQSWCHVRGGGRLLRRASTGGVEHPRYTSRAASLRRMARLRHSVCGRGTASALLHRSQANLTPPREPCYSVTSTPDNAANSFSQLIAELDSCQLSQPEDKRDQPVVYTSAVDVISSPKTARGPVQRKLSWLKRRAPLSPGDIRSGSGLLPLCSPAPLLSPATVKHQPSHSVVIAPEILTADGASNEPAPTALAESRPASTASDEYRALAGIRENYSDDGSLDYRRKESAVRGTVHGGSPGQGVTAPIYVTSLHCRLAPQPAGGAQRAEQQVPLGLPSPPNTLGKSSVQCEDSISSTQVCVAQSSTRSFADKLAFFQSRTDAPLELPRTFGGESPAEKNMTTSTPHCELLRDRSHYITCAELSDSFSTVLCAADSTQRGAEAVAEDDSSNDTSHVTAPSEQQVAASSCHSFSSHTAGSSFDVEKMAVPKSESPRKDVRFSPVVSSIYSDCKITHTRSVGQSEEVTAGGEGFDTGERGHIGSSTSALSQRSGQVSDPLVDVDRSDVCLSGRSGSSDPPGMCTAVDCDLFYNDDDDLLHVNRAPNLQLMSGGVQECCCASPLPTVGDILYRDGTDVLDVPRYPRGGHQVEGVRYRDVELGTADDPSDHLGSELQVNTDPGMFNCTDLNNNYARSVENLSSAKDIDNINGPDIDDLCYHEERNRLDASDKIPLSSEEYDSHGSNDIFHCRDGHNVYNTSAIEQQQDNSANEIQYDPNDFAESLHQTSVLRRRSESELETLRSYDEIEVSPGPAEPHVRRFDLTCEPGQTCSVRAERNPDGVITVTRTRSTCQGDLLSRQNDLVADTHVHARISAARKL